jgi:hypothetical protein
MQLTIFCDSGPSLLKWHPYCVTAYYGYYMNIPVRTDIYQIQLNSIDCRPDQSTAKQSTGTRQVVIAIA